MIESFLIGPNMGPPVEMKENRQEIQFFDIGIGI